MRVRCPICGRSQRVTEAEMGLPTLCAACGNRFDIPSAESAADIAPVSTTVDPGEAVGVAAGDTPSNHTLLWLATVVLAFAGGVAIGWVVHSTIPPSAVLAPPTSSVHGSAPTTEKVSIPSSPSTPALLGRTIVQMPAQREVDTPATEPASRPVNRPAAIAAAPAAARRDVLHPVVPARAAAPTPDQQIGTAIDRGTRYLLSQFKNGQLAGYDSLGKVTYSGLDALACYAILQAGQATHDPKLGPHAPEIEALLDGLRSLPLDRQKETFPPSPGQPFTYAHSLRAAALSVLNRDEDRPTLRADCAWLLRAQRNGAYTYGLPPNIRGPMANQVWDNSNSQYGALGVWAALQSDIEVPSSYWNNVEKHWLDTQMDNGQWGYSPGGRDAELSMTVAGITTLFVTQDQLSLSIQATSLGRPPLIPALARGLAWLETGDNAVSLPFTNRTYNLYGLERAALASGFKYFGSHDWYRELSRGALRLQSPDGSWQQEDPTVDTAFTLLFLSRGRHPILMNKLRFDSSWANRPRDLANLAAFTSKKLERQFNWQVVSLASDFTEWTDSPVLYIASHQPIFFSDADLHKLRNYALSGGLIYLQTDGNSPAFDRFAADLAGQLFPEYRLDALPAESPLFSTLYPLKAPPRVLGVSNGVRLLLIHCPADVNRVWQLRNWTTNPAEFQFGVDVFLYAAGRANFLNKLAGTYVPPSTVPSIGDVTIARVRYAGADDPEPVALSRWARQFQNRTSIHPTVVDRSLSQLRGSGAKVAVLSGTARAAWTAADADNLHRYLADGGIVLVDCAGGSTDFAQSVREGLVVPAVGNAGLSALGSDDPLLQPTFAGMVPVRLRLRPFESQLLGRAFDTLEQGAFQLGRVLFSRHDLGSALLGATTYPIDGFTPESATDLMNNTVLWALQR